MPIDGKRVARLREGLGLTQEELVAAIKKKGGQIEQTQMSKIENSGPGVAGSVRRPRCLPELADALHTSQDYLLRKTDDPAPPVVSITKKGSHTATALQIDGTYVLLPLWQVAAPNGAKGGVLLLARADS